MDPLTASLGQQGAATVLGSGINAGGNALGGVSGAIGQSQSNRARGRQAAQMDPFIEALTSLGEQIGMQGQSIAEGGSYGGLRGQASRELARGGEALNAQLAARGIYNSGTGMAAQAGLAGDVYSQLAQAINQDRLTREQIGLGALGTQAGLTSQNLQAIASTPGFGYYDRDTGQTRGK